LAQQAILVWLDRGRERAAARRKYARGRELCWISRQATSNRNGPLPNAIAVPRRSCDRAAGGL